MTGFPAALLVDHRAVFGQLLLNELEVALQVADVLRKIVGFAECVCRDGFDLGRRSQHRLDTATRQVLHGVCRRDGLRIRRGEVQDAADREEREHLEAARNLLVEPPDRHRVVEARAQAHHRQRQLLRERVEKIRLGEPALAHHDLGHALATLGLQLQGLLDRLARHQATANEDLADPLARSTRLSRRLRRLTRILALDQLDVITQPGDAQDLLDGAVRVNEAQPPPDAHQRILGVQERLERLARDHRHVRQVDHDLQLARLQARGYRRAQGFDARSLVERPVREEVRDHPDPGPRDLRHLRTREVP